MSPTESSPNLSGTSIIDRSSKAPVLIYLLSGLKWLLLASVVGYIASWKSHNPEFLNGLSFLTVGRIQAVYTATFVYGFGCNFAFGAGLWLMARLSGAEIRHTLALIIAAVFWNGALAVGVVGILIGDLQAFEFLELPSYVALPLFLSSLIVCVWGILCFKDRTHSDVYASQWYLLVAFLAFPWIQMVAQVMLVCNPAPGVVQALVASWFAGNLVWLWFGAIAVAGLYYLIPKILGKRLLAYSLAQIGFFVLVFAGSWTGVASLVGGPFPAWIITSGIVASLLMLIFFVVTGLNFVGTIWQNREGITENGILLFAGFASLALLVSGVAATLLSLRGVAEISQFTVLLDAHRFLILYGVFSMTMFAMVYYILPRILDREWPMKFLITTHFWLSFLGIIFLVLPLTLGGWKQGVAMMDASIPFAEVVRYTSYWMVGRSMAWIFLTVGHLTLMLHVLVMLRPDCETCVEDLIRSETETAGGAES